jgi:dihydroflavonol-4-reductase
MNILITGGSGFLGSYLVKTALEKGWDVRASVRSIKQSEALRKALKLNAEQSQRLSFATADLLDPRAWKEACLNRDVVIHSASPFPQLSPKSDDDVLIPARQGTLNVLEGARSAGVQRVVLTSSSSAIAYGRKGQDRSGLFDPSDWTDASVLKDTNAYYRSKTLAERAAWDFAKLHSMQLTTICPGAILGPLMSPSMSASINLVSKLMQNSVPALPKIGYESVDVRSVAELHILAAENESVVGKRLIGTSAYVRFSDIARILKPAFPNRKFPKSELPDWGVRMFSNFEPTLRPILIELGAERRLDSSESRDLLHWKPIAIEQSIRECAQSLIDFGLVK